MKKPDIPGNENERLAALRSVKILDTPFEERFDRATRLARRMFKVPIALVSLVDENRQWFKSCMGLDATETDRGISFCGHAILSDQIFVIADATKDGRFSDNPLVTGPPHIRFYAGCPLKLFNRHRVGTLCLIDTEPRNLSDTEFEALRELARMVERELSEIQWANLDRLTGLSNRKGFLDLAQQALNQQRLTRQPITLTRIKLNNFETVMAALDKATLESVLFRQGQVLLEPGISHLATVVGRTAPDTFCVLSMDLNEPEFISEQLAEAARRIWTLRHLTDDLIELDIESIAITESNRDLLTQLIDA